MKGTRLTAREEKVALADLAVETPMTNQTTSLVLDGGKERVVCK